MLNCWLLTGTTRPSTGFSALKLAVAEVGAEQTPTGVLVPDLVIAFTCTPVDRPCVASNRFEMNWNSAIESWLKRGWLPAAELGRDLLSVEIELELPRLAAVPIRQRRGALVDDVRLPGASSASAIQLRPATGSSCTCCGSTLPPRLEVVTFSSGASAVTVTVSCTVDGAIWRLTLAVWPTSSCTPVRVTVVKPCSSAEIRYAPTRAGMR